MILVTLCGLAAGAIVRHVGEAYTPLHVAIVDNEDSVFSRILVRTVGKMDYIAGLLQTERMREEEAEEALKAGECAAVILLPDGFTEDITHGRTAQGEIVLSPAMQSGATLVSSVARFGERMLLAGQYGVFCGERLLGVHGMPASAYEAYYTASNAALIGEATSAAGRYFKEETVDYLDTAMSGEAYFALIWTLTLLFLSSLFFLPLFLTDCTKPMLCRLSALGVGNFGFMRTKLFLAFLLRLILLTALFALLLPMGITVMGAGSFFALLAAAAYLAVIGAALSMSMGNGVTSNVIFAVVGLFLCGGLVPRQLLPAYLTEIGALTPFGAAADLLAPAFGGTVSTFGICAACVWLIGAVLLINRHLTRTRLGKGGAG